MDDKPLALDLYCGRGGWAKGFLAAGWRVMGVDIEDFSSEYPGEFVQADVMRWELWRVLPVQIVLASEPCQEFSRWSMPWTRAKNPPYPSRSLELMKRSDYIAFEKMVPLIRENVRGAQQFIGRSRLNCGAFHLWGDVPAIIPPFAGKKKESYGSKDIARRAEVPFHLAFHIAQVFKNYDNATFTT